MIENEMINYIISKCSKLAQKEYKARCDWVEKVIHWELCKKLKFDHTNKSVLENETHKLLRDFEIQMDHLILPRQPVLVIVNKIKRTCQIVNFAVSAKRKMSTWTLLGNLKNVEYESDCDTYCNWCSWYNNQTIGTGTG